MEALVFHPGEGGRKEGGGQFPGAGHLMDGWSRICLGGGNGDERTCPGNNNEGRVFRLKRTSQSLHKRRKFIECAHCLQPGLVGAGAGLESSSDSVDQVTSAGTGFTCQEDV